MKDPVDTLLVDLLEWIGSGTRPYSEVMDAWRTSCPRLPIWEEANDRGFIARLHDPERGALLAVTRSGRQFIDAHR